MPAEKITACPTSEVDLWSDDVLADPYPAYRSLRDLGSVVRLEAAGVYAFPRFEEVKNVLTNWRQFSSAAGVGMEPIGNEYTPESTIKSDPPQHDGYRRPMTHQLSNKALSSDIAEIEIKADQVAAAVASAGTFDGVADLARPFSLDVVCDLVGIPKHCRDHLPLLAEKAFNIFGPDNDLLQEASPALNEMRGTLADLAKTNAYEPDKRAAELVEMGRAEQVLLYTWPGIDTTVNGISAALYLFAKHPEQWDLLRADPSLIPSAFAEALRIHTPVHYFTRMTTEDVDIDGVVVPEGQRVLMMYGSANRDERHYADPDRFDVTRNPKDHLAFGRGVHLCVGANLAKHEGHAILRALAERVERFDLAGDVTWLRNNTLHGLDTLPLIATAA